MWVFFGTDANFTEISQLSGKVLSVPETSSKLSNSKQAPAVRRPAVHLALLLESYFTPQRLHPLFRLFSLLFICSGIQTMKKKRLNKSY